MKKTILFILLFVLVIILISGLIPHQVTGHGKSCDWSFTANSQVCHQTVNTWWRHGWLVRGLTGCKTVGMCRWDK